MEIAQESLKIEWVDPKTLKHDPKNPNNHPSEQIERLKQIIRYQGWRWPIIVSLQDGYIKAGHGRQLAAVDMGLEKVPVCYQSFIDETQAKAFMTSDNAIARWSDLNLDIIQEDMKGFNPDFNIDLLGILNFKIPEEEKKEPGCDEDEAPEKAPLRAKMGDLFEMGGHRLLCGDSTDISAVEKLMAGQKADMVFTDPPYNTGMTAKKQGDSTRLNHMFDDDFTYEEWQDLMSSFCSNYWMSMKENSVAYICLDWRRNHELIPHIKKHFKLSNIIIWDKMVHGLGSDYKYTYELINVCKKGKPEIDSHQGEDREYSDVWHIQRKMGRDEEHATKKPIEIVERALNHASHKNEIILDLFGGSGSTLIASEKTDRKCFMMELSPMYVGIIIERWQKYSHKKAFLLLDGEKIPWDELDNKQEGDNQ